MPQKGKKAPSKAPSILPGTEGSNPSFGSLGASKNTRDSVIISEGTKGVLSPVLSPKEAQKTRAGAEFCG